MKKKFHKSIGTKRGTKAGLAEVPVLYQNLNGELYAFTELSGQVYWTKVQQSLAEESQEEGRGASLSMTSEKSV